MYLVLIPLYESAIQYLPYLKQTHERTQSTHVANELFLCHEHDLHWFCCQFEIMHIQQVGE